MVLRFEFTCFNISSYLVVQKQVLPPWQVDYEVMKVENHELRKRALEAELKKGTHVDMEVLRKIIPMIRIYEMNTWYFKHNLLPLLLSTLVCLM